MLRRRTCILLLSATFWLGPHTLAGAQDDAADDDESDRFAKLVEGAEHRDGYFETYVKDGKLYLVVPGDRLGKDFLLTSHISQGVGSNMLFGGLMLDALIDHRLVAIERFGDQVFLVQRPVNFMADDGSAEARAVDLSFSSSVLNSAEIETSLGDSTVVVDATKWFVSDLSDVSRYVKQAVGTENGKPGRATLDKDRSHLKSVEGFDDNVNIDVRLTFNPAEPKDVRGVPDSRYISLSIQHGLVRLPEVPMTPRIADDRVGFFVTAKKNFSKEDRTFFERYVWKWRLECAGESGDDGLCDPVKPIRYYIDHTVSEKYRDVMIEAVEAYVPAFEKAGFRNAITAEVLPDSADPDDIRYATLRWNTSDQASYGAIGPSIKDPRTGEILDADILFEADMVIGLSNTWRRVVDPTTAIESMLDVSELELWSLASGGEMSAFGAQLAAQGAILHAALVSRGALGPGDPMPEEFVHEFIKWVTMHEVGHTLGLRHNFRSSADTPLDKLHDRGWTEENGVFSSVMEYPALNLSRAGEENGFYYNPVVGSYDRWAIAYGYTPDDKRAAELARLAAQPGHAYGTDHDARGPGALDPTVNVFDLGADPLAWGKSRADLIKSLWPEVPEIALADDEAYFEATYTLRTLLSAYGQALATGVKYIGGQYQYRDHVGDPNGRRPFEPVPRERQIEALDFIVDNVFAEDAFSVEPAVLQNLGADRWVHWGADGTVNGRIDYPLHETVLGVQSSILERITDPFVFARILDAEHKFGADSVLGIPELMSRLSESIWAEAWAAPGRNVPASRRSLQRAHLDRLTKIVVDPPDRTPADARSVARLVLEDLADRLSRRLTPPYDFDPYTLAHYKESLARAERTIEAGLEMED